MKPAEECSCRAGSEAWCLPWLQIQQWLHPEAAATAKPSPSKAFNHFLLHTGGRGVIDDIQTRLQIAEDKVAPARETLHRFGNTSVASTW